MIAEEKESLVKQVFSSVASKYDVMNDLMSMGAHRLWKDELIRMIGYDAASKAEPDLIPRHLDVAGGTGDIAFRSAIELTKCYQSTVKSMTSTQVDTLLDDERQVVVCDINPDMLSVGRGRVVSAVGINTSKLIGFVEGNAERLPFEDNSFDLYTIAFGLRNVTNKDVALKEAYRVLKPGGRIMIMEFSSLNNPMLQQMYDGYSFNVIPKIGELVANDRESYQYLVESIRKFPKQEELLGMVRAAGFGCASYRNLTFGVVAVHSGFKI